LELNAVVLHARETAVSFYKKLGYTKEGNVFEEVGIPHWKMTKPL
jgi:predicted GNAT family N-acyltransferase